MADQYYKDKPMVYADWDSTFVAYCLYHAGVPQDIIPQYASISALRGELARMNSEYYTDDPQEFASILPGDIVMYKNAEGCETIGVVSDAAVDEETDLTTALTVISGDVATGCESDGETTIDPDGRGERCPERGHQLCVRQCRGGVWYQRFDG